MKNLILAALFGLSLNVSSTYASIQTEAQDNSTIVVQVQQDDQPGFFGKIKNWVAGGAIAIIVGFVAAILKKKGLMPKIKLFSQIVSKFSRKAAKIADEVSDVLEDVAETSDMVGGAISDTGEFDTSKIAEISDSAKKIIADSKEVIEEVKKK